MTPEKIDAMAEEVTIRVLEWNDLTSTLQACRNGIAHPSWQSRWNLSLRIAKEAIASCALEMGDRVEEFPDQTMVKGNRRC